MPTIAIYLIVALVLSGGSFAAGYRVESWHAAAREQAAIDTAIAQYKAEAVKANAAAADLEKQRDEENARNQALSARVNTITAKPGYSTRTCLDADSVHAANAALAGQTASPTGAHPSMPTAKPAH